MKPTSARLATGFIIALFGTFLLLGNLDIFNFGALLGDWWPLFIIAAGVLTYLNDRKNYLWALIAVLVGSLLLLRELGYTDVNPWQLFWPLVIIAVGVSMMINRAASPARQISQTDRDDATAVLSGTEQLNSSDDYKGGKATAIMGGVKIDLRKAVIKKEATIDIFSFWGGVEIIVPRHLAIKNQANVVLGGLEIKADQEIVKDAPVLYITGDVIMAGVEIKN